MDDLGTVAVATGTADAGGSPEVPLETPSTGGEGGAPEIPETPTEGELPAEGEEEPALPEEEPEGGEEPADPGSLEAKIRGEISALKKTNPAAAKAWAKDHYEKLAFQKEFPTVHDARNAKATIESLGGEEGIGKMQEELTDWRGEAEAFANGDRGLITQLLQENPDALVTAGQNVLDVLMEHSEKMYDAATIPHMEARLTNAGVPQMLQQIAEHIKAGDGQAAWDKMTELRGWFNKLKTMSDKLGEGKAKRQAANPEREQIETEKQQIAAEKAQIKFDKIGADVNRLNNQATSKLVEPFFRELRLSTEGRKHFIDQLYSNIFRSIKNDKAFARNEKAIRAKGDVGRSAQFIHAKFRELLPQQFRSLRNALYPNYKPKAAATPAKPNGAATAASANGGARPAAAQVASGATLTAKPANSEVDWGKTPHEAWIAGKGIVLKNGKTVNIDWSRVPR